MQGFLCALLVLTSVGLGVAELTCVSCAAGYFLDQQSVVCRRCPANSSTFDYSNASQATDCLCSPGFSNGTERCEPCSRGFYKEELDNASCVSCMANANTLLGASSVPEDCMCQPGFTVAEPAGSAAAEVCAECAPGSFKGWLGDEPCAACPADHYCVSGAVEPQACPSHSVSGDGAGSVYGCTCLEGYYHEFTHSEPPRLVCLPCPPGTYADALNTSTCSSCPSDTFFDRWGGVSATDCQACPAHSSSAPSSANVTDCFCNLGYAGDPGQPCTPCAAGFFRSDPDTYICQACGPDTYNEDTASTTEDDCMHCPSGTLSAGASDAEIDCVCRAGSFATLSADGLRWQCHECGAGSYQEAANSSACDVCAAGSASSAVGADSASVCAQCDDGFVALQPAAASCAPCAAGEWQDLSDPLRHSQPCAACPGNSSHAVSASTDIHDCVCFAGFVKVSPSPTEYTCGRCRPGAFCPGNGSQVECPYNSWAPGGVFPGPCVECAALSLAINRGSMQGRHQCQCVPGAEGGYDSECALCAPGKFQPLNYTYPDGPDFAPGDAATPTLCRACPSGSYSDLAGAVSCSSCPLHTNSTPDSSDVTDCVCLPSYYGPDGGPCAECPADSFCLGGVAATQCRPHASSPPLSAQESDCKCDPGYYSTPDELACRKCPAGSFCHGDQHVEPCPSNSSSATGAASVEACTCAPGMWRGCIRTGDGAYLDLQGQPCEIQWTNACVLCEANDICVNNTLLHCPTHSTAPAGSSDEHDCVCDDGYYNVFLHDPSLHEHDVAYEHAT